MIDVAVVITEKKNVSKKIARALYPESFDGRDNCICEHNDIISLRSRKEKSKVLEQKNIPCQCIKLKNSNFFYFCSKDCIKSCDFIAQHIDLMGKDHASTIKGKLRYENEIREEAGEDSITFEDISYYILDKDGEKVIIMDTQGTPLFHSLMNGGDRKTLERLILESEEWESIEENFAYRSKLEISKGISHKARERLFNNVLAKRKLPDGNSINLRRIIAATDYDIAGSYIFYSVIMNANQFIRRGQENRIRTEEISLDMLYRMKLSRMDSESIIKEFKNPILFDFGNAHAGKLRSLFDFIYGSTLTSNLNRGISSYSKNKDLHLSVGRVRYLGLVKLIEQERIIRESPEENYIYLIFDELKDKKGIEKDLNKGDFTVLKIKQKKLRVSHSRFLRVLEENNIGTHTTRYKVAKVLTNLKLAECSDTEICSTYFGQHFYNLLKLYIDNQEGFSLSTWNKILHTTIESFKLSATQFGVQGNDWFTSKSNDFMKYFIKEFKNHLIHLRLNWDYICRQIAEICERTEDTGGIRKYNEGKQEIKVPEDGILLTGNSSILSLEQIVEFMDSKNNKVKQETKRVLGIYRYIERDKVSFEDSIRRICCIDREYDFKVEGDVSKILEIDKGKYTVFRAPASEKDNLAKFLKQRIGIDSYKEMDIFDLPKEGEEFAHEPLHLTDISPSDMQGMRGFCLIQEYNLPWIMSKDKLDKKNQGLINLDLFTLENYNFKRIERYKFGRVHKFESLLTAMFEKYNIPFEDTAKMAEQLYLGGS